MKKVFAIFIAVLYLAVSSGIALEIHHCMGKILDFSLVHSGGHKCGKCGMPKGSNECCKDELKFVKLQDFHKLIDADYKITAPEAVFVSTHFLVNHTAIGLVPIKDHNNNSPPQFPSSLCILNCVFRI